MNAPTDAAAVREAAARLCEQEASDYRHGQAAAVERGDKLYRMGQKDAALLLAAAIRQLDLPGGEEVERLRAALEGDLRGKLSATAVRVLTSPRFDSKGWEPLNPNTPVINELVEQGLFRRADARCGFEKLKDAWIKPTAAGLLARATLTPARVERSEE